MIAKNPAATTPFVELDDGTVLAESVACVRYLDALAVADGDDGGAPARPLLTGGPCPLEAARVEMWGRRVEHQLISPWQRQFQNGEGAHYFTRHVPWIEASRPSVPGLRKQVEASLAWLEAQMAARAAAGEDTGFLAGTGSYTVADLQLITTCEFMGTKVNTGKVTEKWDAREHFGDWLNGWNGRMRGVVAELMGATK